MILPIAGPKTWVNTADNTTEVRAGTDSTVTYVNRGCAFVVRRSTLDFRLGEKQRDSLIRGVLERGTLEHRGIPLISKRLPPRTLR